MLTTKTYIYRSTLTNPYKNLGKNHITSLREILRVNSKISRFWKFQYCKIANVLNWFIGLTQSESQQVRL